MALPLPVALGTGSSTSTVSTLAITTSAGISAGDTVYVVVACGATQPSAVSCADTGSNTYTARYALDASGVCVLKTTAAAPVSAGAAALTLTLVGGTSAVAATVHKMPAITLTSGAADQVYPASSSVTHSHSITEKGGAYMLAFDVSFGSASTASAAGYTDINKVVTGAGRGLDVAYNEPAADGSTTYTVTWGAAHTGQIVALTEVQVSSSAHLLALTGAGS